MFYRRQLIKKMLQDEREVEGYLKGITVKDALFMAADAWDAVKPTTIQHCWEKALPAQGSAVHDDDDDDDFMGFTPEEAAAAQSKFHDLLDSNVSLADLLLRWSEMDEDAPVASDTKDTAAIVEEEEEEAATAAPVLPDLPPHRTPTASEALRGCEDLIKFCDSNVGLLDPAEFHHLNNILRKVRDKATTTKKQMKLSDFFTTSNRD